MSSPSPSPAAPARIALLSPLVIDQIAAGEVVERPASVVKELVDNAIDAGATRVDVELEEGGLALIAVRDNGRGIHPDDLLLAVTRHATSKLRDPSELTDIGTLGFRGEALASIAAVARLDLRSRQPSAAVGHHLHARPGEPPRMTPAGLPVGTQVEVHGLFNNLPARRKFMRAEATEVGQCSEILLRLAIVHPEVHVTLRHGKRELLNLPRGTLEQRVAQVLGRRVSGALFGFAGEEDDTRVQVWLPAPDAAGRGRGGPYLVVRRRVVRERSLAQIVAQAYGLSGEASACLIVEPPRASVDVNVHPQKSEIRFSDPQRVYAAVRRVLAAAMAAAPWAGAPVRREETAEPETARPSEPPQAIAAMASPAEARHDSGRARLRAVDGARDELSGGTAGSRRGEARPWSADGGREELSGGTAGSRRGEPRPGSADGMREELSGGTGGSRRGEARPWSAEGGREELSWGPGAAAGLGDADDDGEEAGWRGDPSGADALSAGTGDPRPLAHERERRGAPPAATGPARDRLPGGTGARGGLTEGTADRARGPLAGESGDRSRGLAEGTGARARGPADGTAERAHGPAEAAGDRSREGLAEGTAERARGLAEGTAERARGSAEAVGDHGRGGLSERTGDGARGEPPAGAGDREALSGGTGAEEARGASDPRGGDLAARPGEARGGYRLSTRALAPDYDRHKRGVMAEAAALRPASEPPAAPQSDVWADPRRPDGPDAPTLFAPEVLAPVAADVDAPQGASVERSSGPVRADLPQLLTCLPGPVAVFAERDALLAIDLRRLRSHLVYLRLQRDIIGRRVVAVQGLLAPAVVRRPREEVALIVAARAELLKLGVDLDDFGGDAVVVRGVPAHLRHCVDDADVADLIARIVPWLRIRTREADRSAVERGLLGAIAATRGGDPAPRLARRWLAELLEAGATLSEVPGLRRWSAAALLGEATGPLRRSPIGRDDGAAV